MMIRRLLKKLRSFSGLSEGVAALEFALVGPIHIALLFTCLEAGFLCTRTSLLDHAVYKASKYVYVGAAKDGDVTQTELEAYICGELGKFVVNCENNLAVEVTKLATFDQDIATDAPCRDSSVDIEPVVNFTPGGSSDLMLMRVCLITDLINPLLGMGRDMSPTESGRFQIVSATAFVNEPF